MKLYIYPAQAYTGNEEEISLQYSVVAKLNFETENASTTAEKVQGIELTEKENKGTLLTFGVTRVEKNIYKGFMYSNVENKNNYDTDYNTVSTLCILNSNDSNELTMKMEENKFVLNNKENTEILSEGKLLYKSTEISKTEFDKILGQEGSIEIYNEETLLATLKYIDVTENEETVKKLAIIYSEDNIKILSPEETTAKIEYGEGIESLIIKTTKPVSEGYMNFKNENTIKASENYNADVSKLKSIKTTSVINKQEENVELPLLEPETKISVNSSNVNFSTLQTSKTTLTIKLDSTNETTKLFNNPTITIKLPDGIKNGILSSPEIVNGNGLTIKNANATNNVVTIELEGKQTSYDLTNVSDGASIVMDIENIDFDSTLPTHKDNIIVTCEQNKEQVEATKEVNIVSKAGLLVLSNITGLEDGKTITSIDNEPKVVEIQNNADQKEITQTINLVNNYDVKLTNTQIIGRIGYISEELNSTFDIELSKPIEIENGKVYYSTNKSATYNDESWTEEFTNQAKAYKIELEGSELETKATTQIKLYFKAQANIGYNQETYVKTEINYTYNGQNLSDSTIFGMGTPENGLAVYSTSNQSVVTSESGTQIPVNVTITPAISQEYVHSGQIVTYKIEVTNNGTETLNNIIVEDRIPDNAIYTYVEEKEGMVANYNAIVQDTETKTVTWNIEKLEPNTVKEFEIMLTMSDVEEEQEIKNTVVLTCNNQSITTEKKLTLKPALIKTELDYDGSSIINLDFDKDSIVEYRIKVKNVTSNNLKNIKVEYEIPGNLEYVNGGLGVWDEFEGYSIDKEGEINNNKFEYNISELEEKKETTIVVRCKVKKLEQGYEATISGIANVDLDKDIYQTNIKEIKTVQTDFNISQEVNVKENTILNKEDTVIYTIKVENKGKRGKIVTIKDNVPSEISIEKMEYGTNENNMKTVHKPNNDIECTPFIDVSKTLVIKITGKVNEIKREKEETIQIKNVAKLVLGDKESESNEITLKINTYVSKEDFDDPDDSIDSEIPSKPITPENPSQPTTPETPTDPTNPETPTEPTNPEEKLYTISGKVWLDTNKNGTKDENENWQNNITVTLINNTTGNFALDSNRNKITATTDEQGKYTFNNLTSGTYSVMFEFDTNKYTVTTYQKEGILQEINSDAILSTVTINGVNKLVALTDKLELTSNKENIDLGLIENAKFDLSLDKQITKITVVNKQGTETFEYKDGHTAKVDLVAKYMAGSEVIVNYKFTIANEGEVTGYVNSLMDSLPSGLEFNSEMNKDWYKDSDGNLYTTSLSGKAVKPGETTEIELILTKTMTENNAGTFANNAKLEKMSNLENIAEKEEAKENNASSALLVISIKTGSVVLYLGITTICLAIIGIGIYLIKKKVLNRGI